MKFNAGNSILLMALLVITVPSQDRFAMAGKKGGAPAQGAHDPNDLSDLDSLPNLLTHQGAVNIRGRNWHVSSDGNTVRMKRF